MPGKYVPEEEQTFILIWTKLFTILTILTLLRLNEKENVSKTLT